MRRQRWVLTGAACGCWAAVLLILAAALAGCGDVLLSPEYSDLLDRTAALSAETCERAEAGDLDANQMRRALCGQAGVWQQFRAARDGGE